MPRNVEIKAAIASIETLTPAVAALADSGPFVIFQDDTFFACQNGRLKLRAFSPDAGELIAYRRADQGGPKESVYVLSPTSSPDSMRTALAMSCGEIGRVRKRRTLFLAGRTRIHLDEVEQLGQFLELEVVLQDGEATEAGESEAQALMARLGVQRSQLLAPAYVDLLAERRRVTSPP